MTTEHPIALVNAAGYNIACQHGKKGSTTMREINETLQAWEVCNARMEPTTEETPPEQKERPIKQLVPQEYHDLLDIFAQKEPTEPPPHRYHDHRIPIEEGKRPLFEAIRGLDEKKL